MRTLMVLTGALILLSVASSFAANPKSVMEESKVEQWEELLKYDMDGASVRSFVDTVWLGGSGLGDGTVVRNGLWDFEAASGEPPEFFLDGDPVGNQFRDGWTFGDFTGIGGTAYASSGTPKVLGGGHWFANDVYELENYSGGFAHRATFHDNDGINDGPDPLTNGGGAWSVWIGTNLYLNPEICGWHNTAGHGDGWSQGIMKEYAITASAGAPIDISFYHRYAVEAGFDTCWVEISFDGQFWDQVGTAENPNGIYNGGDLAGPLPTAAGGSETVQLTQWPGGTGPFFVRFRFSSDGLWSDETQGGEQFWTWAIDDVSLLLSSVPQDFADFETEMGGWVPARFEGFDFDITLDPDRAAGRIVPYGDLQCPITVPCPEGCGLEGNLLIFTDKDDCDLHDEFMNSYAHTPAMSIGGPENPDLDGTSGRLLQLDLYHDGGTGFFETGVYVDWMYWPYDLNNCPYEPTGGAPGTGETFNWSRTQSDLYNTFGNGPNCLTQWNRELSTNIPAEADSVVIAVGAIAQCRGEVTCDPADGGSPFFDNIRLGIYDPAGSAITNRTFDQFCDSYPLAEQAHNGLSPGSSRTDGAFNHPAVLGLEIPPRYVRADSSVIRTLAPNAASYLRWIVNPGPCQNLAHPFFAAYPPGAWHEARMDTAKAGGTGLPLVGEYSTCYYFDEPNNGTSWGGEMTPLEPCDDILPDGVFTPGTHVYYFFEVRDATSGTAIGTTPSVRNYGIIDTLLNFRPYWREFRVLPTLIAGGGCDPNNANDRANDILFISDTQGGARFRMQAVMNAFGLDYDMYTVVGTGWGNSYNGIGRREDRPTQAPRPPHNGATQAQLEPYQVIWYCSDLFDNGTLSDSQTMSIFGGQPTQDLQKLENWLHGCSTGENRFMILEGYSWASDIDANTTHGPTFMSGELGVDVLGPDYEAHSGDLRRCARISGTAGGGAQNYDGEIWGTGCPDDFPADLLTTVSGGQVVANYVNSLEDGTAPVDCTDDVDMPGWAHTIRKIQGSGNCQRTLAMASTFTRISPLNCTDECLFSEWAIGAGTVHGTPITNSPAQMISDMFAWGGRPIGAPIAVENPAGSPALRTQLIGARPNPANPSANISFSLAQQGHVSLKVFDVSGRLVRTLIDEAMESASTPFEVVWDGTNNNGQSVGSGVFFYQLEAPGYTSAKKLVILK